LWRGDWQTTLSDSEDRRPVEQLAVERCRRYGTWIWHPTARQRSLQLLPTVLQISALAEVMCSQEMWLFMTLQCEWWMWCYWWRFHCSTVERQRPEVALCFQEMWLFMTLQCEWWMWCYWWRFHCSTVERQRPEVALCFQDMENEWINLACSVSWLSSWH